MTARSEITALLTATGSLPGVTIIPYARQIDPPLASTVMVRIDRVVPSKVAGLQDYEFTLVLIAAQTAAGPGDDELDNLLEDVIFAVLKASPAGVVFREARRATYQESNPAYEVACTVTVKKE